ncbi:Glutathione transport system permease protein GsiC [bioreactor metagenome]|uniref:Glutathione transport system permease protein GsiC n=1 Tax=bioreactor metagenome TaxID=1076179 RepID=A0A645ASM3_9ZZZZ
MYKFVIKRILFLIPTILGVIFIIFFIMQLTPGNPGRMILGVNALQVDVDALNHELGYDLPFFQRFINYIREIVVNHNFGTSYYTKKPVFDELWPRFVVTINLSLIGIVFSTLVGVPMGIYSAVRQYTLWDTIPTTIAFFLAAIPGFVVGMVLLLVFSLKLNWLPSYGMGSIRHYIMPAITASLPMAAQNLRFTKSSMLEEIRQDYVRTARAKGVSERNVIWKQALRNALLPVVTTIGLNFGVLICGAIVAEKLFSLPGVGTAVIDRISTKDEPIILAGVIMMSVAFTIIMLAVDIIYAYIDPRIKAKYMKLRG